MGSQYPSILNEKVLGKSASLKKCEILLDEAIEAYQSFPVQYDTFLFSMKEVEKELEAHFNFSSMSFSVTGLSAGTLVLANNYSRRKAEEKRREEEEKITGKKSEERIVINENPIQSYIVPNMSTLGTSPDVALKKLLTSRESIYSITGTGIRWNNDSRPFTSILFNTAFFKLPGVTGGEILSVILHEIGHSFYIGSNTSRILDLMASVGGLMFHGLIYIDSALTALTIKASENFIFRALLNFSFTIFSELVVSVNAILQGQYNVTGLDTLVRKVFGKEAGEATGNLTNLATQINMLLLILRQFSVFPIAFLGNLMNSISNLSNSLVSLLRLDGVTGEKFSDEFAVLHGYGPELQTALGRLHGVGYTKESRDVTLERASTSLQLINTTLYSVLNPLHTLLDPHPGLDSRSVFIADYYKQAIKNAKTPKERKFLEEQYVVVIKNSPQYMVKSASGRKKQVETAIASAKAGIKMGNLEKLKDYFTDNQYLLSTILRSETLSEEATSELVSLLENLEINGV